MSIVFIQQIQALLSGDSLDILLYFLHFVNNNFIKPVIQMFPNICILGFALEQYKPTNCKKERNVKIEATVQGGGCRCVYENCMAYYNTRKLL